MEKRKLVIGQWYKNPSDWEGPKDFCKARLSGTKNNWIYYSERIDEGTYEKEDDSWGFADTCVEAELHEYAQYLPDGHPDKILATPIKSLEIGKWYELDDTGYYFKYNGLKKDNVVGASEYITDKGTFVKLNGQFGSLGSRTFQLLTDLSEIQEFLPDGHPDKLNVPILLNESHVGKHVSFTYGRITYENCYVVKEFGSIYILNNTQSNNDGYSDKTVYKYSLKFGTFKEANDCCFNIRILNNDDPIISSQELTSFPLEGYCATTNQKLVDYLKSRPNQRPAPTVRRPNGIAWNVSSFWWIESTSSKKEYKLSELEPLLIDKLGEEPEVKEFAVGTYVVYLSSYGGHPTGTVTTIIEELDYDTIATNLKYCGSNSWCNRATSDCKWFATENEATEFAKTLNEAKDRDLLAEARTRYPIGVRFNPAHVTDSYAFVTNEKFIIESNTIYSLTDEGSYCSEDLKYGDGSNYNRIVYRYGKWAEILPPLSWCVKATTENIHVIKKHFSDVSSLKFDVGSYYGIKRSGEKGGRSGTAAFGADPVHFVKEITTDEFYKKIDYTPIIVKAKEPDNIFVIGKQLSEIPLTNKHIQCYRDGNEKYLSTKYVLSTTPKRTITDVTDDYFEVSGFIQGWFKKSDALNTNTDVQSFACGVNIESGKTYSITLKDNTNWLVTVDSLKNGNIYRKISLDITHGRFKTGSIVNWGELKSITNIRLATQDEIVWLNKCETEGKFVELTKKSELVGRYIKAVISRPEGGSVSAGEYGKIITENSSGDLTVDFPFHSAYYIHNGNVFKTKWYEIMPIGWAPEVVELTSLPKKSVKCTNQFEWDFVIKTLDYKVCTSASFRSNDLIRLDKDDCHLSGTIFSFDYKVYTFSEWCLEFGHKPIDTWCVKLTEENREEVKKFMNCPDKYWSYNIGSYYGLTMRGEKYGHQESKTFNDNVLTTQEFYEKVGYVKVGIVDISGSMVTNPCREIPLVNTVVEPFKFLRTIKSIPIYTEPIVGKRKVREVIELKLKPRNKINLVV